MMTKKIVLISFYNPKQIGVKYLQAALEKRGFSVLTIALKAYNSRSIKGPTDKEILILKEQLEISNPLFVGLSVNSSFVLDGVISVQKMLDSIGVLSLWGGVFPTLMPEKAFQLGAKYIIAGEGEEAIGIFAESVRDNRELSKTPNLIYQKNGDVVKNPLLPLEKNLDLYGLPQACSKDRIFINNNKLILRDPNIDSYGYELSATRGCPFECTYCSSPNLKRMYGSRGYLRHRSVKHIIDELLDAKRRIKKLRFIHFWDEIFPDNRDWIDEFEYSYKKEIGLPFEIWGHPLCINPYTMERLVSAGLYEITVGIQSGSEYIRREIFNRSEKEEQILKSSKILKNCGVPYIVYDFMLRHPFETLEDLKQTYGLCMKLEMPFQLQLHGLGFLPGTDICARAIEQGIYSAEELDGLMFGTSSEVFEEFWGRDKEEPEINFWYNLIYLTQFSLFRNRTKLYSQNPNRYKKAVEIDVRIARRLETLRYLNKKSKVFLRLT